MTELVAAQTERAAWLTRLQGAPALADLAQRFEEAGVLEQSGVSGLGRLLVPFGIARPPFLFVVARDRDIEAAVGDLELLCREAGLEGDVLPFPSPGPPVFRSLPRHADASARRARALAAATHVRLLALVASVPALLRPSLTQRLLDTRTIALAKGDELTPDILLEALDDGGYRREDPVTAPGQVALRGGILDLFPSDRDRPVRLEFFGDVIESMREFDPESQRTLRSLDTLLTLPLSDLFPTRSLHEALRPILASRFAGRRELALLLSSLDRGLWPEEATDLLTIVPGATQPPWAHLPPMTTILLDPDGIRVEARAVHQRAGEDRARRGEAIVPEIAEALVPEADLLARLALSPRIEFRDLDEPAQDALVVRSVRRYAGDTRALAADLGRWTQSGGHSVLFLGNRGRADRLSDVLAEQGLVASSEGALQIKVGNLSEGCELPRPGLLLLADGDIFPEEVHLHARGRRTTARSFLSDFQDLRPGDLVVHQDHGVGRFEGLETLDIAGQRLDFMVLSYHGGDKLKVPVDAFDRVQKHGHAAGRPTLDKLGTGSWEKVKRRVKKAMRDMAEELLRLYAERKARPGHAFTGESPWQHEFEAAFEYEETPDQAQAIADVARDMADPSPMDRLVLGDVGYGKTEVAMRAAMRAVLDGKQVAVLAPTTVLAFQHWKTFRARFAPFPVTVEMVSRFRSAKEARAVLERLAAGAVDILVGTHRMLSKDVIFRDLGLLVIDEEQRFGVAAKERLKQLRTVVDCLTLSATPIPRTLQMGLSGLRDMSVIETPPRDRLAIQTMVVKFSTDTIAGALRQELARGGQVYVVHNRVESLYSFAALVQKLVPEGRVAVAHGQMPEAELEKAMMTFVEGRADILVSTTIVENGLDIPRANTLIVNRADRYGLSQLYQLRGRVGRADRQAFAYLLIPPDTVLSEIARKRLAAIRNFSDLGAGFRIAALDLELRGGGNLLGGEQSGHIQAVGLDLFVKLLEQTVAQIQGEAGAETLRATLNLRLDLRIPESYVPDVNQRMAVYKRVSQLKNPAEASTLTDELRDRYGPSPLSVARLITYGALRLRAERLGIAQVDALTGALAIRFGSAAPLSPAEAIRFVESEVGASLTPTGLRIAAHPGTDQLMSLQTFLDRLERALAPGPRPFAER